MESPVVETRYGNVQGFTISCSNASHADIFLGVPFAKPPLGDLRFEKPQPPDPWTEVYQATKFADACTAPEMRIATFGETFSENCLYLNIYAPSEKKEPSPVMVIIHGGGFMTGSARMYRDYGDISDSFVSKGIVVVVIQYRLSLYGFGYVGDAELPGNLGLWDQLAALKFVNENIAAFGGDPKRITLYGCSAGAASISALSVSPHSRDLFSQAVEMSGSILAPWGISDNAEWLTKELLTHLALPAVGGQEAKEFLKNVSSQDVENALKKVIKVRTEAAYSMRFQIPSRKELNLARFGPRFDGDFFPKHVKELLKEAPKKPTLIGVTQEEALMMAVIDFGGENPMNPMLIPKAKQASYGAADFEKFVVERVATKECFGEKADEVAKLITAYYMNAADSEKKENLFFLRRYTQLLSDILFNVPILRETETKAANGWPVFVYEMVHLHKTEFMASPFDAATHGHDQGFIYRGRNWYFPMNFTEEDEKVSDFLIESIAAFVKTGNPSTDGYTWPKATAAGMEHVHIKPQPVTREQLFADRLHFWDKLMQKYGNECAI
ncbi:CRE-GES-1 protein [Aphelenchoides avenae]|nr:CRE-GES-1 protein [Aphelenchus avenae]